MSTLHIETELARSVSANMASAVDLLQQTLLNLNNDISRLANVWMGNSADEFQNSFLKWSHQVKQIIDELESLKNQLEIEIAEWETAASKL